jgi:cytochrome c oxidase subunit II
VLVRVTASDVIHSFWVPQLQGKLDMIPGHELTLRLQAHEAGRFRGQCAEYCGAAHALMALWIVALPGDEHAAWLASEKAAASAADPPGVETGRGVFFASGCAACHATRGAPLPDTLGSPGPDLSTMALRHMIAAGTLPNERQALARWIRNPQRIKPGVRMPPTTLPDAEMNALLDYLETLR